MHPRRLCIFTNIIFHLFFFFLVDFFASAASLLANDPGCASITTFAPIAARAAQRDAKSWSASFLGLSAWNLPRTKYHIPSESS
jgi:hypothetical protein